MAAPKPWHLRGRDMTEDPEAEAAFRCCPRLAGHLGDKCWAGVLGIKASRY